jgi:hypothetical protein
MVLYRTLFLVIHDAMCQYLSNKKGKLETTAIHFKRDNAPWLPKHKGIREIEIRMCLYFLTKLKTHCLVTSECHGTMVLTIRSYDAVSLDFLFIY